jgi:hypothetical protein
MSPEEMRRMFNIYEPTEALVADIQAGGQKALSALTQIVDGISKQATTIAQYQARQLVEELGGRIAPLEKHYSEAQLDKIKTEFFKEFPDLQGYELICGAVRDQLAQSGFKANSKKEAFAAVAKGAREAIKSLPGAQAAAGGTGAAGAGAGGNKNAGNGNAGAARSGMPTLLRGGQGGGSSGQAGGKPPAGMELFQPKR